jgi:hypothetical protein
MALTALAPVLPAPVLITWSPPVLARHVQAYGAEAYPRLGLVLQRAQLACTAIALPSVLLWSTGAMAQLLPLLGQPPEVAAEAAR